MQKRDAGEHWQGWELADDKPVIRRVTASGWRTIVVRLANRWPDDAIEVQTKERVQVNKGSMRSRLHQMLVEYDGSGKASGIKFYWMASRLKRKSSKIICAAIFAPRPRWKSATRTLGTPFEGAMDDLRIYDRTLTDKEVEYLAVRLPARALLMSLNGRPADGDCHPPAREGSRRTSRSARKTKPKPRTR